MIDSAVLFDRALCAGLLPLLHWLSKRLFLRAAATSADVTNLAHSIPSEVPYRRDLARWELRRIARSVMSSPELLRGVSRKILPIFDAHCRPRLEQAVEEASQAGGGDLLREVVDPNFVLLAGLCVACSLPSTPDGSFALAWAAVLTNELPYRLPNRGRRAIFQCCATLDWAGVPPRLALPVLQGAFLRAPCLLLWRRLLGVFAAIQDWHSLLNRSRRPRRYVRATLRALRQELTTTVRVGWFERAPCREAVLAAELIARAHIAIDRFDRRSARQWILPLLERSTGLFLARTRAAGFVCEHLHELGEACAAQVAGMIERGIAPLAWDDYSNFRQAFSMKSWPLLRRSLTKAGIVTELDHFVTEADRCEFWRWFNGEGAQNVRSELGLERAAALSRRPEAILQGAR
jgi:hypothetical protein